MRYGITFFLLVAAAAGCSTTPGRNLAEDLSSSTATYEKQINVKIAAENAFYEKQLANVRKHLGGEFDFKAYTELPDQPDPATGVSPKTKFMGDLVKNTVLYGRIRFGAEREAELAAARIVDGTAAPTIAIVR